MMKDSKHKTDFFDISVEYYFSCTGGIDYFCKISFKHNDLDDMISRIDEGFEVRYWRGNKVSKHPPPSLSKMVNQLIAELKTNRIRNIKDVVRISKKFFNFKFGSHNFYDFILKSL